MCAPFVKARTLQTILSAVEPPIFVRIITRWRAEEVAVGVSDLAAFEIANDRPNTELALLDDLHAKLYLADDRGFVGSANLTAAALGWAERANVEILVAVERNEPDVVRLLKRLDTAVPATFAIRSAVEAEAAASAMHSLGESLDVAEEFSDVSQSGWFPRCAAPDRLHLIYANPQTTDVVEGTRSDGQADLSDLHLPGGLQSVEFAESVRETLILMPTFRRIVDRIPEGVTDADGVGIVMQERAYLDERDAGRQWRIIRDWIEVFFRDQFEVAPQSFVTRLRSK